MVDGLRDNKKISVVEIVEDDHSLRMALRNKLEFEGYEVIEASNGSEGLVTALRKHPDLILLDIAMPIMDGLTMMKKLRQENTWGNNVPIILLTNLSADDDKINQAIADYSPAYYLVKSNWKISDLIDKIDERLSRSVV